MEGPHGTSLCLNPSWIPQFFQVCLVPKFTLVQLLNQLPSPPLSNSPLYLPLPLPLLPSPTLPPLPPPPPPTLPSPTLPPPTLPSPTLPSTSPLQPSPLQPSPLQLFALPPLPPPTLPSPTLPSASPSPSTVAAEQKTPGSLPPRYLEEEGLYVGERPKVRWTNQVAVENRFLRRADKVGRARWKIN